MFDWFKDFIETGTDMAHAAGQITDFIKVITGLATGDLTELSSANPIGSMTDGSTVPGSLADSISGSN